MKAYSSDLRERVIETYKNGLKSMRKISSIFKVGKSSVSRWIRNGIETKRYPERKKILDPFRESVNNLTETKPWLTLKKICHYVEETHHKIVSRSTLSRYLKEIGITYKQMRKKTMTPKNTRDEVIKFREEIRAIGYENILSFDETGFIIEMFPKKGWSKKGKKCFYTTGKGGHLHITGTFIISTKGIVKWWISKDGMNIEKMLKYLEELEDVRGKTLIMDNLRVHHNKDVLEKVGKKGMNVKFTLPYSPELNPVEEVFSWIKRKLRDVIIRTEKELKMALEELIKKMNGEELLNYFKHSYDEK
jgi:transposase